MPVNYVVQANVIDITVDTPTKTDSFLVDTNVWYWLTYSSASSSAQAYQINHYPNYIAATSTVEAALFYSGLSFAELAGLIEKAEQRLSRYRSVRPKEYRHNYRSERAKVVTEMQTAWTQVQSYAAQLDLVVGPATVNAASNSFQTQCLDGYDLFILETMKQRSVTRIITDDGDYVTVSGIQVFTANRNVISAAASQGKLLSR